MKLPKTVRVLGKNYKLEHILRKCMGGALGQCSYSDQTLRIAKDSGEECQVETLLHEIIHSISGELDLGLKEAQVRQLSVCLYAVLRDNKVAWRTLWDR